VPDAPTGYDPMLSWGALAPVAKTTRLVVPVGQAVTVSGAATPVVPAASTAAVKSKLVARTRAAALPDVKSPSAKFVG